MAAVLGAVAAAWGVVMAFSPSLQIRRMWVTRSSRDVSIGYYLILIPGFGLWIAYGVASHDAALTVPNAVAVIVAVCLVGVAGRLRRGGR